MRLVFLGTPEIAVPSLEAVVRAGHDVRLVVSQPDRARGRGHKLQPTPIHAAAERLGLPLAQPTAIRTAEFEARLRALDADVFLVVAYGRFIPDNLLALAPDRWINLHPSLLPHYRGPAPVQGPLFNGDAVTGVTTMVLVPEMDAGDILLQWETDILPDETAGKLHDRLAELGAACVVETLAGLERGDLTPQPQDHAQATFTHKLTTADGILDFRRPARALYHQTRAVTPWPGARVMLAGAPLLVRRARAEDARVEAPPGTVTAADAAGIRVATGDGEYVILELQRAGKRRQTADAFLRGHPLRTGDRFALPEH